MSIRSRALNSRNDQTAQDARRIDQNPTGVLRGLQKDLRDGSFTFALQKGVLKKRKGKKPRPLVISPVTNRIVQRAILETLQSDSPSIRRQLGSIQQLLNTPTSVGGIPKRGAQDAVRLIVNAIESGATYFIRSDIKDFFTGVPTAELIQFIETETIDPGFARLIEDGLKVELENADDPKVQVWLDLFPDGETGVPQGSSLAAFCANVTLAEFDRVLNRDGVVMVRYIDDFVILGASQKAVEKAWVRGKNLLQKLKLEAWPPSPGGQKASLGQITSGFDFLSFRFNGEHVSLSRSTKQRLLIEVDTAITEAKKAIQKSSTVTRRAEPRFAQTLAHLDRKLRGWGDSFKEVTLRLEFSQIDNEISDRIRSFIGWYSNQTKDLSDRDKQRALGVALLSDTPRPNSGRWT